MASLNRLTPRNAGVLGVRRALAQHLDALLILSQVDQLKIGGERLEHGQRLGQVIDQRRNHGLDLLAGSSIATAPGFGQAADLLFQLQDIAALLLDDRLAQQVAEQVNIGAELLLLLFYVHILAATRSPITTVPTTSLPVSAMSPVRTP